MAEPRADRPPQPWTGRVDGEDPAHARWHTVVRPWSPGEPLAPGTAVLVGFASDEGVRRNQGRVGAAEGPDALRRALASLAAPGLPLADAGDVVVADGRLEEGQERLGALVRAVLAAGGLPVVLGGGHEVAYGSYRGWAGASGWGILNLDAHFDLRGDDLATSGTPFAQAARDEAARGRPLAYAVAGISRADNTRALFESAAALSTRVLLDEHCDPATARAFAAGFAAGLERVHLSLDLDVLPAAVAPGVSAPAGLGVDVAAIRAAIAAISASGRLGLLEVAELNPRLDVDGRTARTAARLVDAALRAHPLTSSLPEVPGPSTR